MIIEPSLTDPDCMPTDLRAHVSSFLDKEALNVFNGISRDCRAAAQRDLENTFYGPLFDKIKEYHGNQLPTLHDVDLTASLNNHEKVSQG